MTRHNQPSGKHSDPKLPPNTSLHQGTVQHNYKDSTVICCLNNYRTIALASFVMKLFEHSPLKSVTTPLMDTHQFIYRANRSVEDAVNLTFSTWTHPTCIIGRELGLTLTPTHPKHIVDFRRSLSPKTWFDIFDQLKYLWSTHHNNGLFLVLTIKCYTNTYHMIKANQRLF